MHVLVLPSWFPTACRPHNGAYFYRHLQALQQAGHRVGVVYPEHQSLRDASPSALMRHWFQTRWCLEHGLPVVRRHGWNALSALPGSVALRIRAAVRLGRQYAATYGRPDVVHALSAQWAAGAAARLATHWNRPMALTEHFSGFLRGGLRSEQRRWARHAFARANAIAAVSPPLRRALHDGGWHPASQTAVLPNPVDFAFFTPPASRPKPPPLVWASAGRLVPVKGFDVLLRAVARGVARGLPIRLHLAGDGPERTALQHLARDLAIQDRVRFLGHVPPRGIRRLLQRAHGYVLASHHETFGLPVLEALACGCPVLATRCGGPEYVVPPGSGLLVDAGSVAALSKGLLQMSQRLQRPERPFVSPKARSGLHNRFGYDTFVANTCALYRTAHRRFTPSR